MKCQESKQKIYALIDKEISIHEERGLYSHLSNCSKCMEEYNLARDLDEILKETVTYVDPPDDFHDNIMNMIMEEENFTSSSKEEPEKKKFLNFNFLVKVAGIIFALFLGLNALSSNIYQVADNPDSKNKLKLPVLSEFKEEKDKFLEKIAGIDKENTLDEKNKNKGLETTHKNVTTESKDNETQAINEKEKESKTEENKNNIDNTQKENTETKVTENKKSPANAENRKENPGEPPKRLPALEGPVVIASKNNPAYRINVDRLSFTGVENISKPYWSHNGEKVYFITKDESGYYWHEGQLNNGSAQKILGPISSPGVFSPVGNKVAFTHENNVWVLDSYGALKNVSTSFEGFDPVWSPNGELAYLTKKFGGTDIVILDSSGKNRRLTFSSENEKYIAWSPNGKKVAYYRYWTEKETGKQVGQIYVQNTDGSGLKAVTPKVYSSRMVPSWSPDGKLLAVNVNGDSNGILEINVDTGDAKLLFEKAGGNSISWSPNGQSIAFNDENGKLYILKRNMVRKLVTEIPYVLKNDTTFSWAPDSSRIVFDMVDPETSRNGLWVAKLPKTIIDY